MAQRRGVLDAGQGAPGGGKTVTAVGLVGPILTDAEGSSDGADVPWRLQVGGRDFHAASRGS